MSPVRKPLPEAGYLSALEVESRSLAVAARRDLAAPVPTCPRWSVAELVSHVWSVHRRVAFMIAGRQLSEASFSVVMVPGPASALVEWFEEGAGELRRALGRTGRESPVWN
ncbi:MAG: maleylpyruvate isomerase N-terminal domain-containing protein, partial [Acidimicrobiales bacterium]